MTHPPRRSLILVRDRPGDRRVRGATRPVGSAPGGAYRIARRARRGSSSRSTIGRRSRGRAPTLSFSADAITGSGGCNHLGGSYRLDDATGRIAVGDLGTTLIGCQPAIADYETLFVRALGARRRRPGSTAGDGFDSPARRARSSSCRSSTRERAHEPSRLRRTASARLALLLLAAVAAIACAPGAVRLPPAGQSPELAQRDDLAGRRHPGSPAAGSAGTDLSCSGRTARSKATAAATRFGGIPTYVPATGALHIEALVSTKRACVEPARNEVEAAYLQALRTVAVASIDPDGRLVLTGAGAEVVLEVGPQQVGPGVTLPPSNAP